MASSLSMLVTTAVVSYLLISTVLLGLVAVLDRFPFRDHLREQCWKWSMGLPLIIVTVQLVTAVPKFAPRIVMQSSSVPVVTAVDHSVVAPNQEDVSGSLPVRDDRSFPTSSRTPVTVTQPQTRPTGSSLWAIGAAGNPPVRQPLPAAAGSSNVDAVIPADRQQRQANSTAPAGAESPGHPAAQVNPRRHDHESPWNGWMAGSLLLALLSVVGVGVFVGQVWRHHRFISHCRPLSEGTAHVVLEQLLRAQQLERPVMLYSSLTAVEPGACGIRAWTIVLPSDLLDRFSADEWRVILRHELAHLQRRDPLWLLTGRLLASAFCWQPLHWWALKRWQETAELQCDATVAEAPARLLLARVLASLAEWKASGQIRPGLSLTASPLVRRVRRLLSDVPHCVPTRVLSGRTIAAAALTGGLLLTAISPRVIWAVPSSLTPSLLSFSPPTRMAARQHHRGVRTRAGAVRPRGPSTIRQQESATSELPGGLKNEVTREVPRGLTEELALATRELNALQVDLAHAILLIQKSPRYERLRPQARILKQRLQQLRASLPVE